jgi:peptidoglycan/xylan/chitin deacetylase (PgdA/CDA1 family)
MDIHRVFLTAFRAHRLPPVYGFVNGASVERHPEDRAALREWVTAGNPLGNHTRTHPDLYKTTVDAYLADLDANEPLLREMAGGADERTWRVFRYPFLQEGTDKASRARLRQQLVARGYRIAEVTIDFYDWAYNEPYARCVARNDLRGISALKASYLAYATAALQWSDAAARELVGRPIEQILLLHIGAFDAELLDELLSLYERQGVHFVSLEKALADPVYSTEPAPPTAWEGTFLSQIREAHGVRDPPDLALPEALLDAMCR